VPTTIEQSYNYCRDIARSRAKNFYYSFLLLEKPQRQAMCAVYAFNRYCDDLSDESSTDDISEKQIRIAQWRTDLDCALAGDYGDHPLWPAFHDTVARYKIPRQYFHEMIDGISSDLKPKQLQTFDELYRYCYQVASVVGLTIIHIFGYQSAEALQLAEKCGVAFQLTNIIRDVREDASLGRVYLPSEDLARFGVTVEQLRSGYEDTGFRKLLHFEAERAQRYFHASAKLSTLIQPKSRASLWALRAIYMRLLNRIKAENYTVLSRRINVPTRTKVALLIQAFVTRPQ
jgi:15-cis-phytoene synthase